MKTKDDRSEERRLCMLRIAGNLGHWEVLHPTPAERNAIEAIYQIINLLQEAQK